VSLPDRRLDALKSPPSASGELLMLATSFRVYPCTMPNFWFRAAIQILIVASPVAAAAEPIVRFDYDQSVNFSKYHSYTWVPRGQDGVSDADYQRVRTAVDRSLASRFKRAEQADFAVAISGVVGRTSGEYQGSYASANSNDSLLSIDIYDTTTKRPFWHGIASSTPGDAERAVKRLLEYFPPSHGCSTLPGDQLLNKCRPF
jgi:hypothetical protein